MRKAHPKIELTDFQHQVLTGLMLGDGHLSKHGCAKGKLAIPRIKNAYLSVKRSQKDADYLRYESRIFSNLLTPKYQKLGIALFTRKPDVRTGNAYSACDFITISNPIFTEYHDKWYRKNGNNKWIKIIPRDLQLSPITMAHWIADDGNISLSKPNLSYRFKLEFATHGFTKKEVEFLVTLLQQRYDEKFNISLSRGQWYILAYDSACRAVFTDIDPHFKMNRKRIWDKAESRFYQDQPGRQISRNDLFFWRKKELAKIIATYTSMTMQELVKRLKYTRTNMCHFQSLFSHFPGQITVDQTIRNNYIIYFNK